jgi:hypothetical protein
MPNKIPKLPFDRIKDSALLPNKLNQKVLAKDEKDRMFLKVFLLDSSVNGNRWGVDPDTVDENIQSAVGKPLVLYKNSGKEPDKGYYPRVAGMYDHPPWDDADINHTFEMQNDYRVGTFIDVVKNMQTGAWWGIAEITNDGLRKALDENPTLPFYVSPSIRRLHTRQANQQIRDWVLMHSAIVSVPAFGVQKAYTSGSCSGDKDRCLLHLRTASLQDANGNKITTDKTALQNNCGCTYEAMQEVGQQTTDKITGTKNQNNNLDTSHLIFSSQVKSRQSLSDPSQTISNSGNENVVVPNVGAGPETVTTQVSTNATNSQPEIQTTQPNVKVEHKVYPNPQQVTVYPNSTKNAENTETTEKNSNNNKNDELIKLIAENERKQKQLQAAYNKINELANDNEKLAKEYQSTNTEVASLRKFVEEQKQINRENEIADVILSASMSQYIPDDAKEEQVRLLSQLPLSVEDIKNKLTAPWYAAFDKVLASKDNNQDNEQQVPQFNQRFASRRIAKLPLGENKAVENESNTKNASLQQQTPSKRYSMTPAQLLGLNQDGGSY